MKKDKEYDFCILGAGIAGLSLADALNERGYSVIVLEKNNVASGASGTPGALVNPATGRRAKKSWKAEQCYRSIRQNLEKVQAFSDKSFFRKNGLLRPALSRKMVRKMREQFEKTNWPGDWCIWQNEQQIKERHPGVNCTGGGLWLPIGLTVDGAAYLNAYAKYLKASDVHVVTECEPRIHQQKTCWKIETSKSLFKSGQLIFCTGYSTIHHLYWKHLRLEGVKGQVARFRADSSRLSFNHSLSSLGYIARLGIDNEFIQGSTYEHDFSEVNTDKEGEEYLRMRLAKTLPKLAKKAELVEQWAGVRVTTPDKKPVLGPHPEIENLHVFTALGSKGLMYGKFLAEHFAEHLKNGTKLFPEISIGRFSKKNSQSIRNLES